MASVRGCFKYGCFGCLGIFAIFLVISLVFGVGVWVDGSRPIDLVESTSTHRPDREGVTLEEWQSVEFQNRDSYQATGEGEIRLNISVVDFTLKPAPAGSQLRLEADYDRARFVLSEEFVERREGGWLYDLRFKKKGFVFQFNDDRAPRLVLHVPEDLVFKIEGRSGVGEFEFNLGGLALTEFDMDTGVGEFRVEFEEPTATPIRSFRLRGDVGENRVVSLGNASPEEVFVSSSVGSTNIYLDGAWQRDSRVSVRHSVGETYIDVPETGAVFELRGGVGVTIGERSIRLPEPPENAEELPTITLDLKASIGQITVR